GNLPAATRSPTVNMTRSAGTGMGTPASIGSSRTRASGPLRPATLPFIAAGLLVTVAVRDAPWAPPSAQGSSPGRPADCCRRGRRAGARRGAPVSAGSGRQQPGRVEGGAGSFGPASAGDQVVVGRRQRAQRAEVALAAGGEVGGEAEDRPPQHTEADPHRHHG